MFMHGRGQTSQSEMTPKEDALSKSWFVSVMRLVFAFECTSQASPAVLESPAGLRLEQLRSVLDTWLALQRV